MEKRIVRIEEGLWRIRTDEGELPESEQKELIEYFNEIKLPYRIIVGCPVLPVKLTEILYSNDWNTFTMDAQRSSHSEQYRTPFIVRTSYCTLSLLCGEKEMAIRNKI